MKINCRCFYQGDFQGFCTLHESAVEMYQALKKAYAHLVVCDDIESHSAETGSEAILMMDKLFVKLEGNISLEQMDDEGMNQY